MHRTVGGFMLVLGAALAWATNPPGLLNALLALGGISPSGALGRLLEGVVIGLFILILQAVLVFLFDVFVLPVFPGQKTGVWVYSLMPEVPNPEFTDERPTVGVFELTQKGSSPRVECGLAFLAGGATLSSRGTWRSDTVAAGRARIDLIYDLDTHTQYKKEQQKEYRGHIRLERLKTKGIIGTPYLGHFNDLKDRSHIKGPIYAEHVSAFTWRFNHYKELLESKKIALLERLSKY
ncbi:MAG TPA: hypothetical protein VFP12_07470 [Allosphingosinicella sp.]|nr:hypothetical protein [Allosphingosinicella sp.]